MKDVFLVIVPQSYSLSRWLFCRMYTDYTTPRWIVFTTTGRVSNPTNGIVSRGGPEALLPAPPYVFLQDVCKT